MNIDDLFPQIPETKTTTKSIWSPSVSRGTLEEDDESKNLQTETNATEKMVQELLSDSGASDSPYDMINFLDS